MMRRTQVLILISVIAVIAMALTGSAAAADTCSENAIRTTGSGNIIGTPDRAQLTFAVQTENTDVNTAQLANAVQMNKVIDALMAAGIPRDALKTTGYSIWPVYDEKPGDLMPRVKTYQVSNTLTVTLHDVSRAGDVIDIAVVNGIN